jgi:sugar phosphate isomerase/epimerase
MTFHERLAVCSWSLQPPSPSVLFQSLRAIGLNRIQIALDPIVREPAVWGRFSEECAREGMLLASGMFGTIGEDYSTMESIKRTGGLAPDIHWAENLRHIALAAREAAKLNLKLVTFHAGFLPHDPADPDFAKLLGRLREVASVFADQGLDLALETGQESAPVLEEFLHMLARPNVGVNFDPANMILYDKGDPIQSLRTLAPFLRQCHIKDAIRTTAPGEWGSEVPVGQGQVDWKAFLSTLKAVGFTGDCCIEREAGNQRVEDIRTAREQIEKIAQTL